MAGPWCMGAAPGPIVGGIGQRNLEAFGRHVAGRAELCLGRIAAARVAYTASRNMLRGLTLSSQRIFDPISGLARVALAEGRPDLALQQVELMRAHMVAGGRSDGTEEPLLLPLNCCQVLHVAEDSRATAVLAAAHAELQAQAALITDLQARRGLLQQVPYHREIVAAWHRSGARETTGRGTATATASVSPIAQPSADRAAR